MQIDSKLEFVPHSAAPQTAVGAAGATVTFSGIIDILGSGVGTVASSIIGNVTLFGEDVGIGRNKPEIQINIGTAFTTGNAATGNFAIQVAPDDGTGNPGTWETAAETGAKPVSELTANQVLRLAMPPAPPNTLRPRFIQLALLVPAATNMNAGTVSWAAIVFVRDDQANRRAARNYVVA